MSQRKNHPAPKITEDDRRLKAKVLYFSGHRIPQIAEAINTPESTVRYWHSTDKWDKFGQAERVNDALGARLCLLIAKDPKEGRDFKEIDLLTRQLARVERVRATPTAPRKGEKRGGDRTNKNYLSPAAIEQIQTAFMDNLFDYQQLWYDNRHQRNRQILKSRQIGATYYFAREALVDALTSGHNKIFLSASKSQAYVFREYIKALAMEAAEVELTGDPMTIRTDDHECTFYFLGTNSKTAQSYHGDIFMDEYFWINNFDEFKKVASAMSSHKQWKRTYFSTPSAVAHEAYPFWTGVAYNRGRKKTEHIHIDTRAKTLASGKLCADNVWRHLVTVEAAADLGCHLFDLGQLKSEYAPDEYAQLFMCEFVDDHDSVFSFGELNRCLVETRRLWPDVKPFANRPVGDDAVAIGIDPAKSRDGCAVSVIALPKVTGGKFRLVERLTLREPLSEAQAAAIAKLCDKYEVAHMEIDETGMGIALAERLAKIYPRLRRVSYNLETKNALVVKAIEIIRSGRLEVDEAAREWVGAFLAIKKTQTASGKYLTYKSDRREDIGHADIAWATMHALAVERIGFDNGGASPARAVVF
ncbi:hypothetical protein GCU85_09290 [Cardiobacteriales bacterium ML27]|uniref:Terminase n=2 Tax=Ostreibacterium oceani TaxID=2654998 RepID=A0A6N7F297_9GAMM|nr:hypothetical protein [Ostreibacterium oceani]